MTIWMGLEGIMLSEISLAEKDKYHRIASICVTATTKKNKTLVGSQNRQVITRGWGWVERVGEMGRLQSKSTNYQLEDNRLYIVL